MLDMIAIAYLSAVAAFALQPDQPRCAVLAVLLGGLLTALRGTYRTAATDG